MSIMEKSYDKDPTLGHRRMESIVEKELEEELSGPVNKKRIRRLMGKNGDKRDISEKKHYQKYKNKRDKRFSKWQKDRENKSGMGIRHNIHIG